MNTTPPIAWTDLDRRIWEEELSDFVPARVFDAHTHAYCWAFNTSPGKEISATYEIAGRQFSEVGWAELEACDAVLLPGRSVSRLVFPFPFSPECDFEGSNAWVARQVAGRRPSGALMLVHPSMRPEDLDRAIGEASFLGFKPYRLYAANGDPVECRITDFLPESQIEVADQRGLLVMLHMAKRAGVADAENLDDLARLTRRYPRVQWILAHCARSYSSWAIEEAAARLRDIDNLWYEVSSVCESDAITALLRAVGVDRVMYGSDDLPVGALRGKYIAFGRAWASLSESNHRLDLSHCDGRMTFVRYEQLRAMRQAARHLGLTPAQIEDLFFNTASRLIQSVRDSRQTESTAQPARRRPNDSPDQFSREVP